MEKLDRCQVLGLPVAKRGSYIIVAKQASTSGTITFDLCFSEARLKQGLAVDA